MFIKYTKHPSPPFTRNYLTHKTLSKKGEGWRFENSFLYIRAARENERGTLGSKNGKTLKKEYNIRFKIYPSPFTSLPQPSFHIFIIGLPTFVFWVYPSEIFCYFSEIISYPSEIFCYLTELCSYPSEILFRMIPWFFRTLFPESTQIAQIA